MNKRDERAKRTSLKKVEADESDDDMPRLL